MVLFNLSNKFAVLRLKLKAVCYSAQDWQDLIKGELIDDPAETVEAFCKDLAGLSIRDRLALARLLRLHRSNGDGFRSRWTEDSRCR